MSPWTFTVGKFISRYGLYGRKIYQTLRKISITDLAALVYWNVVVTVTLLEEQQYCFFFFLFSNIKQRYSTPFYLSVKTVIFPILEDEQKIKKNITNKKTLTR